MRRREFIEGMMVSASLLPNLAQAQRSSDRRLIGFLDGKAQVAGQGLTNVFLQGLRELGYEDGRNLTIVYRFADGRDERLPALAEEIVRLSPALIVAPGVNAAVAAKKLTDTIPIVSWALADATHLGLINSYSRPGGNVTGIMPYVDGLPAKQMELAREIMPGALKIGILGNSNDPKAPPQRKELEEIAHIVKASVVYADALAPDEMPRAMQALAGERVDVVIVLQTGMTLSERRLIGKLALQSNLPTVFGYRENVVDGGLVSYGVDLRWCSHRTAAFVQKILAGTAPGELPVEFPTKVHLAVNLKTAFALKLTVPSSLLHRADEVIE
jgi:putative tryptophan/tyrosine transport system substrate-binding protein